MFGAAAVGFSGTMGADDREEDEVADDPEGSDSEPPPAEGPDTDGDTGSPSKPKRFQRKRPSSGMKLGRMREIKALIDGGREDEVPSEEMAEYEKGLETVKDSFPSLFKEMGTSSAKVAVNPELIAELQRKFSEPVLRNKRIADNLGAALSPPENQGDSFSDKIVPTRTPPVDPSFSSEWIDRVQEARAEELREERERQDRAQAAADENNALLTEVARILQSVESSSAQSEEALRQLGNMRRDADKASDRQFWINMVIAVVALILALLQVLVARN